MAAAPGAAGAAGQAELFDSYFRRADLDQDGRITGHEAVAFFLGSNLPKPVLAQIWTYADQNRSGFLGRPEFYNALKLVTVAQSGRQLTPEIVQAALFGPAAAKIPAPQINSASTPAAQMNTLGTPRPQLNPVVPPSSSLGVVAPTASQTLGFRGPQDTSLGMNRQSFPTNHSVRPSQAAPSSASFPMQGVNQGLSATVSVAGPHPSNSIPPNLSTDWFSSRTTAGVSQGSVRGVSPSTNHLGLVISGTTPGLPSTPQTISSPSSSLPPKPLDQAFPSSQPTVNNSRVLATTGNGFASDTVFGGDVFSANSQLKPDASTPRFSAGNMTNSSGTPSVAAAGYQNSTKTGQFDAFSNSVVSQGVGQLQQTPSSLKQNLDTLQSTSTISASNVSVGPAASASSQSQLPWPKITESNIQKYTTVFVEVDKDRDGKITGDQARNLFLSWKLPREVLKQVWDLSDQDNDSMLSLREFCIALYLMERFREGRPLPAVLPNSVKFDETLLRATPQASNTYSGPTWKPNPGLSQQGIPGSRPPLPVPGVRPPMHSPFPLQADVSRQTMQPRSRGPVQNHLINQSGTEEPNVLNPKFQEAPNASKNVQEPEKEILDSREKIEFYRTKMQELVLYKSRCDNRLNEITERASADKREAESLAKRYEEKYKQVGEIASKLTVEEAAFRHIQERKVELQNAIVKMQQGGSADGLLQVRADRIQSDLEDLMKALNERSKQCGLHVKPTTMIVLPFGWQPGIQDGAAEWNEDWDKFEDQGFALVKDLTVDFDADLSTAKPKSPSSWSDLASADEFSPVSSSNAPDKKGKLSGIGDQITETEPAYDQTEDVFARSPPGSPERNVFESPSHSTEFGTHDISPHAKGSHGDHAGGDSNEPSWSFDGNDDVDSVWGFGTTDSKEVDYDGKHNSFFSSGDFGLNPVKVNSPSAGSTFGQGRSSIFADSVPSTPLFNSGSSPKFNDGPEDHSFNTFSRFDSFSTNDGGLFNQRENFSRFDSMRSTAAYDRRQVDSFSRFDSMRSTADFDHKSGETFSRFDSMRSTADFDRKPAETFSRFDSMRSTADFDRKPAETFSRFDSMRSTADFDRKPAETFSRFDSMRSTADFDHKHGETFARFDSMRSTADFDHKHGETLSRFDSMRSTAEFDRSRGFPSFDDADPFGSTGPFKSSDSHSPRKGSDGWSAF